MLFSQRFVQLIVALGLFLFFLPIFFSLSHFPAPASDISFGVNFSKKYAEELGLDWQEAYLRILDDLGAKKLRLIAYWDDIEGVRGVYDFSDIKWQLSEAKARDAKVILVIGRKVPRYPECFEPTWWRRLSDKTEQEDELIEYIELLTGELRGFSNIEMWQVENEPFFPFGLCQEIKKSTVEKEIAAVRKIDARPILTQDSGEGGVWYPTYKLGDYLAISVYRKVWLDFWGILLRTSMYIKYPTSSWSYKIKADMVKVPFNKIIVTELQAEPWGPTSTVYLNNDEKDKTMSRTDFLDIISYAQKTGLREFYFWGAEWWYFEKTKNNNPYFWETARPLMLNQGQ